MSRHEAPTVHKLDARFYPPSVGLTVAWVAYQEATRALQARDSGQVDESTRRLQDAVTAVMPAQAPRSTTVMPAAVA